MNLERSTREHARQSHKDKTSLEVVTERSRRSADSSSFFIVFSGLAADTTVDDILTCLKDSTVIGGRDGIKMCMWRRMAFVELAAKDDINRAFRGDRKCIGKNCIVNVDRIERSEVESIMRRTKDEIRQKCANSDGIVLLRGLPFTCSKEEIATFFLGLPIAPNGITLMMDEATGRITGDAFVEFTSSDCVAKALEKHKSVIQHRYIEVYQSSSAELKKQLRESHAGGGATGSRRLRPSVYERSPPKGVHGGAVRPVLKGDRFSRRRRDSDEERRPTGRIGRSPVARSRSVEDRDRGLRTGSRIFMRGMAYSITETDIREFLAPVCPMRIVLEQVDGRPTGNALVDLISQRDVEACLKKHGAIIKYRYVEIFHRSRASSRR